MTATTTPLAPATSSATRAAAMACVAAGLLGAASGIYLAVIDPQVPDTRFSYPLSAGAFVAIQLWFVVQHLGLIAGVQALWAAGWAGQGRLARTGLWLTQAGLVVLTITEAYAVRAAESAYPGPHTGTLDVLYGSSTIASGIGFVLLGLAVLRAGVATDAARWLPLVMGVWVFVPMTPAIMLGHVPARLSITAWMLLFAALGYALLRPLRAGDRR